MTEFPGSLVDYIDLPIGADVPGRYGSARRLLGKLVPIRVGRSRLRARVLDVICYQDSVTLWVRLPVIAVALPDHIPACVA